MLLECEDQNCVYKSLLNVDLHPCSEMVAWKPCRHLPELMPEEMLPDQFWLKLFSLSQNSNKKVFFILFKKVIAPQCKFGSIRLELGDMPCENGMFFSLCYVSKEKKIATNFKKNQTISFRNRDLCLSTWGGVS